MGLLRRHACGSCGRRFPGPEELMHHVQTVHPQGRKYDCRECGTSFEGMEQMRTHLQREHSYAGRR